MCIRHWSGVVLKAQLDYPYIPVVETNNLSFQPKLQHTKYQHSWKNEKLLLIVFFLVLQTFVDETFTETFAERFLTKS